MSNEQQLGEGFAYFRWHRLAFPWSGCVGVNDWRNACAREWAALQKGTQSALQCASEKP